MRPRDLFAAERSSFCGKCKDGLQIILPEKNYRQILMIGVDFM